MATDYERFYRENPHGLGEPSREFIRFFERYDGAAAQVLDVGCGQGRDALFIARLGHAVTGIDISATGIRQMVADATAEGLMITGITADIRTHGWTGEFDVILIDRTLHMLAPDEQTSVLARILAVAGPESHLLIADEKSNIPAFRETLAQSSIDWTPILERGGYLFVKRV